MHQLCISQLNSSRVCSKEGENGDEKRVRFQRRPRIRRDRNERKISEATKKGDELKGRRSESTGEEPNK